MKRKTREEFFVMPTNNIKNIIPLKKKEILTSGTEKYCYNIVTQGTIKNRNHGRAVHN
jgi:hypothetical protein